MRRLTPLLLGVALLGSFAASAADFIRAPYVQNVRPDEAIIAFRLDGNCSDARVHYTPEGQGEKTARSTETGRQHGVSLTGLSAGKPVSYRVQACGAVAGPFTFRAATGADTQRVHFATMGDIGVNHRNQIAVGRAIHAARPELVLTLGDNVYPDGTEREWTDNFFTPLAGVLAEIPYFLSLGNHDYVANQAQAQIDAGYMPNNNPRGTERYYSFNWGHVHFVALDSQCYSRWTTTPECSPAEQKAWLEADLEANQQPWTVVYMHHPAYSSGDHGGNPRIADLLPIFEKHGVDMVLAGHDHNYERMHPLRGGRMTAPENGGVPYWVVGTGGVGIKRFAVAQPAITAFRDHTHHGFLNVTVEGGTLTADFVTMDGAVLDTYTTTKALPEAPFLNIGVDAGGSSAPMTATLVSESNIQGATVTWDMGDDTRLQGGRVTHTYRAPGSYVVQATAEGSDGRRAVSQLTLQITGSGAEPDPGDDDSDGNDGGGDGPGPGQGESPGPRPGSGSGDEDPAADGCQSAPAMLLPLALVGLAPLLRRRRLPRR